MTDSNTYGVEWRAAKTCGAGNCVEIAAIDGSIAIRDSKNPESGILRYTVSEWQHFLSGAKNGDFDDLV